MTFCHYKIIILLEKQGAKFHNIVSFFEIIAGHETDLSIRIALLVRPHSVCQQSHMWIMQDVVGAPRVECMTAAPCLLHEHV